MTEAAGEGQAAGGEAAEIRGREREREDEGIQNQTMETIAERKAFRTHTRFSREAHPGKTRRARARARRRLPAVFFSPWMFSLVGL